MSDAQTRGVVVRATPQGQGSVASLPQYAAYLSGEGFVDDPASVHPVVFTYLNAACRVGAGQDERDELVEFLPRLLGSGVYTQAPLLGLQVALAALDEVGFADMLGGGVAGEGQRAVRAVRAFLRCPCEVHAEATAGLLPLLRGSLDALLDDGGAETVPQAALSAVSALAVGVCSTTDMRECSLFTARVARSPLLAVDVTNRVLRLDFARWNVGAVLAIRAYAAIVTMRGWRLREGLRVILDAFDSVTGRTVKSAISASEWSELCNVSDRVAAGETITLPVFVMPQQIARPGSSHATSVASLVDAAGEGPHPTVFPPLRMLAEMTQHMLGEDGARRVWAQAERLVGTDLAHEGPPMDMRLGWWCLNRVRGLLPLTPAMIAAVSTLEVYLGLDQVREAELPALMKAVNACADELPLSEGQSVRVEGAQGAAYAILMGVSSMVRVVATLNGEGDDERLSAFEHRDAATGSLVQCVTACAAIVDALDVADLFDGFLDEFWRLSNSRMRGRVTPAQWREALSTCEEADDDEDES